MDAHAKSARHGDPARSAAALFGAAALITAAGLLLPHVPEVDEGGLTAVATIAGAVTAVLVVGRERIPGRAWPVIAAIGTALVSLGLLFNGERHGGPAGGDEMYYLWIVMWAAFYLGRKALAVEVVLILAAYAATLAAIDPGPSATSRWLSLSGLVVGAAIVVRLLAERVDRLIGELRAAATSDPLTGLANRRGLEAAHAHELAQHGRTGRPFALLVLDLDRFKLINDELGHKAGDRALVDVAKLLQQHVRGADTAARIGGDEFAIVLPDTDRVAAAQLADRLQAAIDHHAAFAGWPGGACMGIATSTDDGSALDDLMRHADSRLYLAKRALRAREEHDAAA